MRAFAWPIIFGSMFLFFLVMAIASFERRLAMQQDAVAQVATKKDLHEAVGKSVEGAHKSTEKTEQVGGAQKKRDDLILKKLNQIEKNTKKS